MSTLRVDTLENTDSSFSINVADLGNTNLLRTELADAIDPTKGAALIGYRGRSLDERLGDTVSVLDFGADPTGVNDSLAAFNAARDAIGINSEFRGGTIVIPRGYYKLSGPWTLTEYSIGQVQNMYVEGSGIQNTTLDFTTATAGTDGVVFVGGAQMGIKGMSINGAKRRGLTFNDTSLFDIGEMRVQNSLADGVYSINSSMGYLKNIWSVSNVGNAFNFAGNHTSIVAERCWGMLSNRGWALNGMTYSSFISCAADQNTTQGFALTNLRGVTFLSCGHESNGADGMLFTTSDSSVASVVIPAEYEDIHGVVLIGCQGYFNNTSSPGNFAAFASATTSNNRPIELTMIGCGSNRGNALDYALVFNGASGTISYSDTSSKHDGPLITFGSVSPLNYLESIRLSGSSIPLTTGVSQNITFLTLPAGDWEVDGTILFTPTGTTTVTGYYCGISVVSNTLPNDQDYTTGGVGYTRAAIPATFNLRSPAVRVRSSGTTIVYLVAQAAFGTSTLVGAGKLTARKL